MVQVEKRIQARAPADTVFAFLTDLDLRPQWQVHLSGVEKLTDGPLGVGTRFVDTGKFGKATLEVTTHKPPTHLAYRAVGGPFAVNVDMLVAAAGDGSTLDVTIRLEPRGLGKLLWLLVGGKATAQVHADLAALERAVQGL